MPTRPQDKKKNDKAKEDDDGPAENTRLQRPTGFLSPSLPTSFSTTREVTDTQLERQRLVDSEIDSKNPSNMYPESSLPIRASGTGVAKWWLDSRGDKQTGITSDVHFLAKAPVETHVYSRAEMVVFSTHSHDIEQDDIDRIPNTPKSFLDIIRSAIALRVNFDRADQQEKEGVHPAAVHRPDEPYADQDLVNLCCLADREREANVDTCYDGKKNKISFRVHSYKLRPGKSLKSYLRPQQTGKKKQDLLPTQMMITIYRSWLKSYLHWFDPDLFQYIVSHTDGVQVTRFANQLAAAEDAVYQFSVRQAFDERRGQLRKMHKEFSTTISFGEVREESFVAWNGFGMN